MNNMGAIMEEPEYEISVADMYEGKVALYVLSRISGKGADRKFIKGDIILKENKKKKKKHVINALASSCKKNMLVLNNLGPVDLSGLEAVSNILVLSQLGVNTSKALGDL